MKITDHETLMKFSIDFQKAFHGAAYTFQQTFAYGLSEGQYSGISKENITDSFNLAVPEELANVPDFIKKYYPNGDETYDVSLLSDEDWDEIQSLF